MNYSIQIKYLISGNYLFMIQSNEVYCKNVRGQHKKQGREHARGLRTPSVGYLLIDGY
jgi:hypothetical protein